MPFKNWLPHTPKRSMAPNKAQKPSKVLMTSFKSENSNATTQGTSQWPGPVLQAGDTQLSKAHPSEFRMLT